MSSHNQSVRPVAPWIGGKRNLAAKIVERLQRIPHRLYAEAFVGMAGVFFRRPERADVEVINDYSRDVATLFRMLQRHYVPFIDMLRYQLTTRAEFERLVATDAETLTDLERAARFLYLQRVSFGGKVVGRTFGVSATGPGRFDVTKLVPILEDVHERLAAVTIECLPYGHFIGRYDRDHTLFYLDPPYFGCEGDYGRDLFTREDFTRLAEQLAGIKGRFLLSLNDVPEVREIFGNFAIESVETTYSVGGGAKAARAAEVLISNAT